MHYGNIREEELKNKVAKDWFVAFDTTEIIGNIDFTLFPKQKSLFEKTPLLWAEAKTGDFDVSTMFVQLILTIGKARTFDKTLPPAFLGAFDFKKIAFIPFISVQDIFFINDFNWNVAPSNHESKEFKLIKERIAATLKQNYSVYDYQKDEKELKYFIANNIAKATTSSKIKIDKNNFIPIYLRWLELVKPNIDVNWDELKQANILDRDFYLADLFVDDKDTQNIQDDSTIRENLFVVFQNQGYKIAKENILQMFDATISLKNHETYQQFWKRYKRPPLKEFQEYIIQRQDLLVPQDIRERKGAFFTPRIWVEKSQEYLTDVLGENWQDQYYIWDCAAGTGNLLAGLTNKYNIYASTLDQSDINVMQERIDHGALLLKNHIFQFDFLNDEFIPISKGGKMPDSLYEIVSDPEKRKKLVIYINPPYAETATNETSNSDRINKRGVSFTKTQEKYSDKIGIATKELFTQFFIRVEKEIPDCHLSSFSKLKYVQGPNFAKFRKYFLAEFKKGFVVPADTFDNVKGSFPISFIIWDLKIKNEIKKIQVDVFDEQANMINIKPFYAYDENRFITDWYKLYHTREKNKQNIGAIGLYGSDFQHSNFIRITDCNDHPNRWTFITSNNLTVTSIYLAVRHVFEATWLNDRDQFLYPNDGWKVDTEFQNDCLAFALFHGQNRISSKAGVNHWIPFTESEVNARERFESRFMSDFIGGKLGKQPQEASSDPLKGVLEEHLELFDTDQNHIPTQHLRFSVEAEVVFSAGRELWRYYHTKHGDAEVASTIHKYNPNASLYDIREYFQGRNEAGKMNSKSEDVEYTRLIGALRESLKVLALKIQPKVYEYGFLRE